jgi:two-component system, NtrC family, sensor kinase
VQLIVRDNGRGMTPDVLEHVFEPFFTAKRGAGEPGTGLGLSITHAIVEAHHGTIRAESAGPGQGSAFTITLPSAQSAEQAPRLHEDSPQNADAQNSRSPQNSVSQPSLKESA